MHPALNQQLQAAHALELSGIRRYISTDHAPVARHTLGQRLGLLRAVRAR